mgnify:CR=1 FL=1
MTEASDIDNDYLTDDDLDEIDVTVDQIVDTEIVDVDGDGTGDAVTETTTTTIDVDGDGVADIVEVTTTTAYDLDGDGVPDLVESATVTGVDVDGDGEFSDDEITIDTTVAMSEELADALADELEAGDTDD